MITCVKGCGSANTLGTRNTLAIAFNSFSCKAHCNSSFALYGSSCTLKVHIQHEPLLSQLSILSSFPLSIGE